MGENKESQSQNVGFDDFRGFNSVFDMYTKWRDAHVNPEVALSPVRSEYIQKLPFGKDDVHVVHGGEQEAIADITPKYIEDLDQRWTEYGAKFLDKMAKSDKSFSLYHGTCGCYFDNYPNVKRAGSSPARTPYGDYMMEMNNIFANLYKALEKNGQLDNTLIMFILDNGPEAEVLPRGRTLSRGAKGSTWEGGARVPTFVY